MKLRGLEPEWHEIDDVEFLLAPLTAPQRTECLGYATDPSTWYQMIEKSVLYSLKDWKGVEDENGPVAFDPSLIPRLPDMTWRKIGKLALRLSKLGAEDAKN